jgi:hypothetical protein
MADAWERLSMRGDELRDRMRVLRRALSQGKIDEDFLLYIARLGDVVVHQLCDELLVHDEEGKITDNTFEHKVLPFGSRPNAKNWLIEIYNHYSFEGMNRVALSLLQRCRTFFGQETDLFERAFEMVEKRMFDGGNYSDVEYQNEMGGLYLGPSILRTESLLEESSLSLIWELDESGAFLKKSYTGNFSREQFQRKRLHIRECARLLMLAYCRDMIHWLRDSINSNEHIYIPSEYEVQRGGVPSQIANTTDCFAYFFRCFALARKFQDISCKQGEYDQSDYNELVGGVFYNLGERMQGEVDSGEFESVRPFLLTELVPWLLGEGDVARDRFERRNIDGVQGEGREGILKGLEGS